MDKLIETFNPDNVVIDSSNIINKNNCSLEIEQIGRRAYINSIRGRSDLLADCTQYNRMDLYEEVLNTWGENPTIEDEVIPEKTFEELKQDKQNELIDAFNRAVEGSFITTEGYKMQFNTDDSLKMFGAIQLLESSGVESGYITDADDITHYDIPVATMKSVQNQMLNRYAECHLLKQQYRKAINNCNSIDDLNNIVILFE